MQKLLRSGFAARVLGTVLLWTALGLLVTTHYHLQGRSSTYVGLAWSIVPFYWVWVLLTPAVFALVRRFDPLEGRRALALGVHASAAAFITLIQLALYTSFMRFIVGPGPDPCASNLACMAQAHATGDLATYVLVAGAYAAFRQHRRADERHRRALRLESQLANSRLAALTAQLQPHFLFNALNTVSVLVLKGEGRTARKAISRLGDLLRGALLSGTVHELPLANEVSFVEAYLEIEGLRFGGQYRFEIDIDPSVEDALVPRLILQPLVENAVRHGLPSRAEAGGCLRVTAQAHGERLRLQVADNGAGLQADSDPGGTGVGLANTRARVRELYGREGRVELTRADGWTLATVDLPLRSLSTDEVGPV